MKVKKLGTKRVLHCSCEYCDSEFEFFPAEAEFGTGPDGEGVYTVQCPLCRTPNVVRGVDGQPRQS